MILKVHFRYLSHFLTSWYPIHYHSSQSKLWVFINSRSLKIQLASIIMQCTHFSCCQEGFKSHSRHVTQHDITQRMSLEPNLRSMNMNRNNFMTFKYKKSWNKAALLNSRFMISFPIKYQIGWQWQKENLQNELCSVPMLRSIEIGMS